LKRGPEEAVVVVVSDYGFHYVVMHVQYTALWR